ncbi:MAG: YciC family protein [Gammaproteobacteria bacterium]
MSLLPQEPSSIGKILDSSFRLYILSFKKLVGLAFIVAIISMIFNIVIQSIMPEIQDNSDPAAMMSILPTLIGGSILVGLLSMFFYIAMVYRLDNVANEIEDNFGEALAAGFRKFPTMLLASILYTLACGLGFVLLVIPGLILSLSLIFYPFLIIVEEESAFEALKSSHKLVWGNWWRTMGVFMVPGVVLFIVFMMLGILAGLFASAEPGISWVDVVNNLMMVIYMPFLYGLGYTQYQDLKLRAYGADLEARMTR